MLHSLFRAPDPGTLINMSGPQWCSIGRRISICCIQFGAGDSSDQVKIGTGMRAISKQLRVLADLVFVWILEQIVLPSVVFF